MPDEGDEIEEDIQADSGDDGDDGDDDDHGIDHEQCQGKVHILSKEPSVAEASNASGNMFSENSDDRCERSPPTSTTIGAHREPSPEKARCTPDDINETIGTKSFPQWENPDADSGFSDSTG